MNYKLAFLSKLSPTALLKLQKLGKLPDAFVKMKVKSLLLL